MTFSIPANSTTVVKITSTRGSGNPNTQGYLDETSAEYAGTIDAEFSFDPGTLIVTEFEYSGGTVDRLETPAKMLIFPTIPYNSGPPLYGQTLFTSIVRATSGDPSIPPAPQLSRFTPIAIGPLFVDSGTGSISGALFWNTSIGVEIINGSRTGKILDNVVAPPLAPRQYPHLADPSIVLEETSATSFLRFIRASLTYGFTSLETHPIPLSAESVIVTETGSWTATANFTLPTEYGQWADDNGLNNPIPEDTNEAGIHYVFLYALDLPATESTLPISAVQVGLLPEMQIDLPESGLKVPMTIEYSASMAEGTWLPLSTFYYPPGQPDALDEGATGSPRFRFPIPGRCFMRFVAEL